MARESNYFMQTRNLLWGLYWPTDYATGADWTDRYGSYAYNGLYYNKEWETKSVNTRISAIETLTLHLLPGLDLRSIFSYDNTSVRDHIISQKEKRYAWHTFFCLYIISSPRQHHK